MTIGKVFCGLLFFAVFISGCDKRSKVVEFESKTWPLELHKGVILESAHYRIYTTTKDKFFHSAVMNLAEKQYDRISSRLSVKPEKKMSVYIFANVNQWKAFTRSRFGSSLNKVFKIRNGGYTYGGIAAFAYMGRYPTLTVLAHELFHLYLSNASKEHVPTWVNEGLACLFEAHEWNGTMPRFSMRKNVFRQEYLRKAFSEGKLIPLEKLLTSRPLGVVDDSQTKLLVYYAQVWALMSFLEETKVKKWHEGFEKMLADIGRKEFTVKTRGYLVTMMNKKKSSFAVAAFLRYITEDIEKFEIAYKKYMEKIAYSRDSLINVYMKNR